MAAYLKAALALIACAAVSYSHAQAVPPGSVPAVAAAAGTGGMTVFKDPATGLFRQPEPDELRALLPAPKAPGPVVQFPSVAGGFGAAVDPSFDSFMVTTRRPDGTLTYECVTPQEVAAMTRARADKPRFPARKEMPDVQ